MAKVSVIDIRPADLETVCTVLRRHVPDKEVWAFGSRVQWTARDYSDLDLAICTDEPIPLKIMGAISEELSESNLPMKVDVLDMASVDEKFRRIIEEEYAVVQRATMVRLLGDVAEITMGQSPPGDTYNKEGIGFPFYQGVADFQARYPKKRVFCVAPTRFAEQGDILLSVRAPIGRVNLATERCSIGRGLASVRAMDSADQTFLEFALRRESDSWHILESQGSVFGSAKKSDLLSLPIPWPKRENRHAIAHILGTLDDKIELNRRMNKTLEAMAQAIFKSWFVDFDPVHAKAEGRDTGLPPEVTDLFPDGFEDSELGKIPRGWRAGVLKDLSHKPRYGYTTSANKAPVGPKFLRITDINKTAWIDWASVPHCQIGNEDFKKYRIYKGDILIARMADPGHGVMIEDDVEAVFASYLIRFRPANKKYSRFLQYWLRSGRYWEQVRGRAIGTTRASLNANALGRFSTVIPPIAVAEAFRRFICCLREHVTANISESESLTSTRNTLLLNFFSNVARETR